MIVIISLSHWFNNIIPLFLPTVVEPGRRAWTKIRAAFGDEVFEESGEGVLCGVIQCYLLKIIYFFVQRPVPSKHILFPSR